MKRVVQSKSFLYSSLLYLCGFFLFLEWLYPVQEVTDTSNLSVFIIYAFFCFFLSLFQMKWWITFLLKGFGLLFIINGLFFDQSFMSMLWFQSLSMEITYNVKTLFTQQWYYLTPTFRSGLFLVLIWLMSYLLHYWFIVMKRILLFVLLTFVYLTVLDTFTAYDADFPIVRTFIIAFIALGIANFMKEMEKESIRFTWIKGTPVWLLPMVAVVLLSALVGYAAPKFEPQWPDPVPFIQGVAGGNGGANAVVQKVGYGEDDSQLGGSFVQDYTPVFQAAVTDDHYWRIETKDVYTGKGWEVSTKPDYQMEPHGEITLSTFSQAVDTERLESRIEFYEDTKINKLVYPYGVSHVEATEEAAFFLDPYSEAIQTRENNDTVSLASYRMTYDNPSFAINELRNVNEDYSAKVLERYTQVPASLPDRIGKLAEEITASEETNYDKAKAVERFFSQSRNGFEYQTTDVPVPGKKEDYVDQFLFDSKVGYCDNFSTSMVVLLRTLDIPARWAKGFTSGEIIAEDVTGSGNTFDVYEVTNSNAHSWVEVYFPEVGWVPFEPTQGFSNLSDFHVNTENNPEEQQDDILEPTPEQDEPKEQPESPEKKEKKATDTSAADDNTGNFSIKWWQVLIGIIVLAGLLGIIYKTRFRWQTYLLAKKLQRNQDAKTYQEAYHHLLKVLDHDEFTKEPGQTLREYAKRVDSHYETEEMGQLTNHFEHMLYRNKLNESQANELTQLWKNLIKRIIG